MGFISKSIFEDNLSFTVLESRYPDAEQMSDPQRTTGIERTPSSPSYQLAMENQSYSSAFQMFAENSVFLRGFPYPRNAIAVVICPLNVLVIKFHIRELHTRRMLKTAR